jgi:SAM-dependent methyltransferase
VSVLPDLRSRATCPELLDLGVPAHEVRRSLADLRFVNRWLGNRRSLLRAVAPHLGPGSSILDVGCASGDVVTFLASRVRGRVLAVGVDVKALHLSEAPRTLRRVVADVRALPFPERSFDVVMASLFLHHFDAPELPGLLRALHGLARRALVVTDLRRALVPFLFGRALFPLLFSSPVSVADGLVSIRRSFLPDELRAAFVAAGLPHVRLSRHFPYRLVAVVEQASGANQS